MADAAPPSVHVHPNEVTQRRTNTPGYRPSALVRHSTCAQPRELGTIESRARHLGSGQFLSRRCLYARQTHRMTLDASSKLAEQDLRFSDESRRLVLQLLKLTVKHKVLHVRSPQQVRSSPL